MIHERSDPHINISQVANCTFGYLPSLSCGGWHDRNAYAHTHIVTHAHVLNRGGFYGVHSVQVQSLDLDLTVRRTCGERRRRWLKNPSLPETSSSLRRCSRVRRGSQRFCPISIRESETEIYVSSRETIDRHLRYALLRTCDWKCGTARSPRRSFVRPESRYW